MNELCHGVATIEIKVIVCKSKLCKIWSMYSKVSIIRPGRSRLLEFEKKIVLVV